MVMMTMLYFLFHSFCNYLLFKYNLIIANPKIKYWYEACNKIGFEMRWANVIVIILSRNQSQKSKKSRKQSKDYDKNCWGLMAFNDEAVGNRYLIEMNDSKVGKKWRNLRWWRWRGVEGRGKGRKEGKKKRIYMPKN